MKKIGEILIDQILALYVIFLQSKIQKGIWDQGLSEQLDILQMWIDRKGASL